MRSRFWLLGFLCEVAVGGEPPKPTGADSGRADTGAPQEVVSEDPEATDTASPRSLFDQPLAVHEDQDGDGYPAPIDCNDTDAGVHPGAVERCDPDDVDEDCNGLADDDELQETPVEGRTASWPDADGDGFGDASADAWWQCDAPPSGRVSGGGDCDDAAPLVGPGQAEVCNLVDDDCDASTDSAGMVALGAICSTAKQLCVYLSSY